MDNVIVKHGLGWVPDYPDIRDFTWGHDDVQEIAKGGAVKLGPLSAPTLPLTFDLRAYCTPIEDQGSLGSCTANAGVGMYEYFEKRAYGKHVNASRLFLYKVTRDLLGWTGDTGAYLRTTMGALVLFGTPPEKYWPYKIVDFDKEPSPFCYAFADNYKAVKYFRLDPPGTAPAALLGIIKKYIVAGFPSMFGFTVYNSYVEANNPTTRGKIPFPMHGEAVAGGHAVVAVGFDDNMMIKNSADPTPGTKGAFLIRNSWGTGWGESGYGWLPYEYVLRGLAEDWWTMISGDWVDTGKFNLPV